MVVKELHKNFIIIESKYEKYKFAIFRAKANNNRAVIKART